MEHKLNENILNYAKMIYQNFLTHMFLFENFLIMEYLKNFYKYFFNLYTYQDNNCIT